MPEVPALTLANHCVWAGKGGPRTVGSLGDDLDREHSAWYVVAASYLVKSRVPTFHVSKSLLDSVTLSDPLAGVNWKDQQLPFPAGIFLLPSREPDLPAWLGWCRVRPGDVISIPGRWRPMACPAGADEFLVFAGACPSGVYSDTFIIACGPDGSFKTDSVIRGVPNRFNYGEIVGTTTSLLLAMLARPELVERDGKRVRTIKNGPAREEWTPNWIGRTYRVQRAEGGGTHNSPRLHWRRGHYRRQACGTGRKDHRIIWIEPHIVGGGDSDG